MDTFQVWLSCVKAKSRYLIKIFITNGSGEFISTKLELSCKTISIGIRYADLYVYEENGLAK